MKNIKFDFNSKVMNSDIPKECFPARFAIATNLIMCVKKPDNSFGFLLFNYEPEKWNQWYPYFSSVNGMYGFHGRTYKDIVDEFKSDILTTEQAKCRVESATKAVEKLLGASNIKVEPSCVPDEFWLKFSKTQDIWTLYYMEFLQITDINMSIDAIDNNVVTLLPLQESTITEVLREGKYRGIEIVDNTLDILNSPDMIKTIKTKAISL